MAAFQEWVRSKKGWLLMGQPPAQQTEEGFEVVTTAEVMRHLEEKGGQPVRQVQCAMEWLPVSRLFIDYSYQRPLSKLKVRKIRDNFDWNAIGSIMVSRRRDGTFAVMDGQHRLAAVRELGAENIELPCLVYSGLSLEQEAWVFYWVNTGRGMPNAIVVFHARLMANEAHARTINATVQASGYTLATSTADAGGEGVIAAVSALQNIYELGDEHDLAAVLRIVRAAYGTETAALAGVFLEGVFHFHHHYQGLYDEARLIRRLKDTPVDQLNRTAKQLMESRMVVARKGVRSKPGALGRAILQVYNYRTTTRALPGWDEVSERAREKGAGDEAAS